MVNWEEPTASDNSGETVVPVQTEGYPSGTRFNQNYHVIEYTATDSSDMSSTCTFTITVQGKPEVGTDSPITFYVVHLHHDLME